jgi:transposase
MEQTSSKVSLDTLERKKLEKLRQAAKDVRINKRLSALLWLADGYSREEVAKLLNVHSRTVKNWLALYRKGGLEALCSLHYRGDPGGLNATQLEQLKTEIATGRFHSASQVCEWVEKTFAKKYSASGMRKLLNRLSCSFHKGLGFPL